MTARNLTTIPAACLERTHPLIIHTDAVQRWLRAHSGIAKLHFTRATPPETRLQRLHQKHQNACPWWLSQADGRLILSATWWDVTKGTALISTYTGNARDGKIALEKMKLVFMSESDRGTVHWFFKGFFWLRYGMMWCEGTIFQFYCF